MVSYFGAFTNSWTKRQIVAGTVVVTVTDAFGQSQQFCVANNAVVEPGETGYAMTEAALGTFLADRWTVDEGPQ